MAQGVIQLKNQSGISSKNTNQKGRKKKASNPSGDRIGEKKILYKFYRCAWNGEDQFIGSLIEKRKNPERITYASIMNWVKSLTSRDLFEEGIYFVRVEI